MSESLIRLVDGALGYRGEPILRGVSVEVTAGDFLVVGGPNGGGKTTLLRSLLGLLPVLSGHLTRAASGIGYVSQQVVAEQALPVTALEWVRLGAAVRLPWWRVGGGRVEAMKALALCGMAAMAKYLIGELSGGQQQRVALARALALEPRCLVLDEPTAGVDRANRDAVAELLEQLVAESGMGLIVVSHDVDAYIERASRLLWVEGGCCEAVDPREFRLRHGGVAR